MPENLDMPPEPEPDSPGQAPDIDIAVLDARWETALPHLKALCAAAANVAAQVIDTPQPAELSIALMDDTQIQALNVQYRGKDKPTNVLSFPPDGFNPVMGDIALAFETCTREAEAKNISLYNHAAHLLVHGYLHLSGYDHEDDIQAGIMEALEINALAKLGIDTPYEDHNV